MLHESWCLALHLVSLVHLMHAPVVAGVMVAIEYKPKHKRTNKGNTVP